MILDYALISLMVLGAVIALVVASRGAYQRWREQFTENARVSLNDMFVFIDPGTLFRINVALFLLLPLLVWLATGAVFFAVVAAIAGAIFPRVAWVVLRNRRLGKLVLQLPDALTMMAGSMRAGASLQQALDMVVKENPAPISQEFSILLREQRLGLALEDSLRGMAQRLKVEDVELFVSAMSIAKEVGGNLSEVLDRLATTLRAKQVMEGKIKALTSQGKLQGIIVGMLPIFLAGILYVMDPAAMMPLFVTCMAGP
ncbi:MAG: type II secretion system F family protein [Burkholderiaceae bacterium]